MGKAKRARKKAAGKPVQPDKPPADNMHSGSKPIGPLDLGVFAALWIPYALMVRRFWFVTDDAYISFRYSKNWALGNGLRFNLGDHTPVEGYSNFLWVMICGVIEWLKLSVEFWPLLISAACGSVLMWLIFVTLRRRFEIGLPIAAAATLIWALYPPVAVYSTSGLATMPFMLMLFVTFERLILRRGGICPIGAGLAALTLALLRIEGLYWVIVFIPMAVVSRWMAKEKFLKPLLVAVGILVVGYGIYYAWRFNYYGLPMPNTAYAKAGMSAKRLARGLDYVAVQVLTQLTPLLMIPASLVILRKKRLAIGLPIVAMSFAFYAYAILVSGDFMAMGRFLAPGWMFTVLLFAWMLSDIGGKTIARQAVALPVAAAIAVVGIMPAFDKHIIPHEFRQRFHFRHNQQQKAFRSEFAQWRFQKINAIKWCVRGRAMKRWLPKDAQFVNGGIGATAYYSELYIHDRNGLVNREVAMMPAIDSHMRSPGHDKTVGFDFFLKYKPDVIRAAIIKSLQTMEQGHSELEARKFFVINYLVGFSREIHERFKLQDQYVVDFRPVPDWEVGGPHQYLVMLRRIPDAESPAHAWRDFQRRAGLLSTR
ncbi:MAG: hypothetical protein IID54_00065 [Proteobacteria bacterium]|nr:hypothetical protein [Pseudomonadota bacterium]